MKKNLLILSAILLASSAIFAQSGKMFLTGNLGYSSYSSKETENNVSTETPGTSTFNLMGEFHYIINNNIAVGLGIGYERESTFERYASNTNKDELYNTSSLFSITPSAIYFIKITDNLKYSPKLFLSFGFGSYDEDDYISNKIVTTSSDLSSIRFGLEPLSFEYKFNSHLALNMAFGSLYYQVQTQSLNENEYQYNKFNLGLNMGAEFALRFYL